MHLRINYQAKKMKKNWKKPVLITHGTLQEITETSLPRHLNNYDRLVADGELGLLASLEI